MTNSEHETWRPVSGFEGRYEVSDLGRVRGVERLDSMGRKVAGKMKPINYVGPRRNYAGVQLSTFENANTIRVTMARAGKSDAEIAEALEVRRTSSRMVNRKVHRLVLEAFVGPCPGGCVGCHGNGDTTDNRLVNLRWDTPGANNRDKREHGTDHQALKTHCPAGHEYSEENTYGGKNAKSRRCKTCARQRSQEQHRSGYISPSKRKAGDH